MSGLLRIVVAAAGLAFATAAVAEDAYYNVPIRDLKITGGDRIPVVSRPNWRARQRTGAMQPRVLLDGKGEAYLTGVSRWARDTALNRRGNLVIRAPRPQGITGTLFVPKADWSGMVGLKFRVPAAQAKASHRAAFYQGKQEHYNQLLRRQVAGAAWFRHQAREARSALNPRAGAGSPNVARPIRTRQNDLTRTYALFSGGRAMSENLQLDRQLVLRPSGSGQPPLVDTDSIPGITVKEIDWEPLIEDLEPKLDPLAASIPADQHAVFFPTFKAAATMVDEVSQQGVSILQLAEPRSQSARTFERYQRQLCLTLDGMARLVGPTVARSVAMTGSEPYFRTGTDVAVLFEASDPQVLGNLLLAQVNLATQKQRQAVPQSGRVAGVAYRGVRSPDRSICCYIARIKGVIVVTNSLNQLERLVGVSKGTVESIASLPEFTFFRNRYRLGDSEETALLFLSDATIRRWCGPRWRIATSRRIRNAAVMAEIQASQLDGLVAGAIKPGPIDTDLATAAAGQLAMTSTGVSSSHAGTLAFMTPIAEIPMPKVTKAEADAYGRWRDGYQRNWTVAFDPIAVRMGVEKGKISADMSVMPLIVRTEYREFMSLTQGGEISPDAGDPHNALAHLIMAINLKSPMFRQADNFATSMGFKTSLSWLGQSIAIYADDDRFWEDLAKVPEDEWDEFFLREVSRLPVAIRAEVASGLKLALFLTATRGFIEQTAPGMTVWESLTYKEQAYVKVSPSEKAKGQEDELENFALYYAPMGDSLVVTLSETMLKRAIDRQIARRTAKAEGKPAGRESKPWLGKNVGLQINHKVLRLATALTREQYQAAMQALAWSNLTILNEWKRRYPGKDPVELHEQFWQTRLICPGGGRYTFNHEFQTMESTVYGHPGQPKLGPAAPPALGGFLSGNFGLTFEEQGMRARVELERK